MSVGSLVTSPNGENSAPNSRTHGGRRRAASAASSPPSRSLKPSFEQAADGTGSGDGGGDSGDDDGATDPGATQSVTSSDASGSAAAATERPPTRRSGWTRRRRRRDAEADGAPQGVCGCGRGEMGAAAGTDRPERQLLFEDQACPVAWVAGITPMDPQKEIMQTCCARSPAGSTR